jgi:short-subunit dehydrogenase
MKLFRFYNKKVVIVTGSTMGIGKEVAKRILRFGGKVVITGRNEMRIEELKKELIYYKGSYLIHQGDVNNMEDNKRMVEETIHTFGKIDILINNAGMSCYGAVDELKMEVAKEVIDTNVYGSLFPVMACLDELKKSKGSILFISSLAGFQGLPGYSCYSLSKMALKPLAQSLSIELKNQQVSVGIAYVGFTENEMAKRTLSPDGKLEMVPLRPKFLTNSRRYTADKILHQVRKRKKRSVHSFIGKISYRLNMLFPTLMNGLLELNYKS